MKRGQSEQIDQTEPAVHERTRCHEQQRSGAVQGARPDACWHHAEVAGQTGTWLYDVARRERYWSDGIYAIFGLRPGAEKPEPGHDNWGCHPDERKRIADTFASLVDHPRDFEFPTRILRPDGSVREILVRGSCDIDEVSGTARRILGSCIDVTDLRNFERLLQDSERRFRLLVESVEDHAIYMLDVDGRVTNWNAGAQRAHGYTSDEIVGAHFSIFYTPQDRDDGLPIAELEAATAGRVASVGWRVRKDGSRFWTTVSITPVHRSDGALIGFAKITRDITAKRQAEAELRESEARYRLLADNVTDMIVQGDMDTTRRYVSPAAREVLGYEPEELVGLKPVDTAHPDETEAYAELLQGIVASGKAVHIIQRRYRRKDGGYVWVEAKVRILRDMLTGEATGYVSSVRDISDRKAVEEELRRKTLLLDRTLDNMNQGLLMTDADGLAKVSNRQLPRLLGLPDGMPGPDTTFADIVNFLAERGDTLAAIGTGVSGHHASEQVCANGTILEVRATELDDGGCVRTYTDVTARRRAEQRAEYIADHDALTGLPNRRAFRERLSRELENPGARTRFGAILCLDLDRFKVVNDTYGHIVGDRLLQAVADRIRAVVRNTGTAARVGGDEFAVILSDPAPGVDAGVLAQTLIDTIGQPVDVGGFFVTIGLSIGIAGALAPQDPEQVVRNADLALYRAKAAGRNTFRFHEPHMDRLGADRLRLELDLSEALAAQQFVLEYQPIVDPLARRVIGFEALVRWQHPQRGRVSPSDFIPLAEETGLITPIGTWVLGAACRAATRWPKALRVSVNVSAIQLRQANFEQVVVAALSGSSLPAERLELEITESVLLNDSEAALGRLERLRTLGVRVALDDFGTGYSSLHYLTMLQLDRIKIDRCFIRRIDEPATATIVAAVVQIASHKKCSVIAEGVETQDQAARAISAGCTEIQGFLYGAPVSGPQIEPVIDRIERQMGRRPRTNRRTKRVAA